MIKHDIGTYYRHNYYVFQYHSHFSAAAIKIAVSPPSVYSLAIVFTSTPTITSKKLNSVALIRKRTISTERPPLVGEVSANFCG
jgi:hypothetical protein